LRKALGVSAPTMSDWLKGNIQDLKGENLSAICDFFQVSASEFLNSDLSVPIPKNKGIIWHSTGTGKTLNSIRLLPLRYKLQNKGEGNFAMNESLME